MQVVNQARCQWCGRAMERVAEIAPSGSEPGLVAFPFRIAAQAQARWSGWQWEILDTRVSAQTARPDVRISRIRLSNRLHDLAARAGE